MTIPEKSWINYINMLSAISKTAARKFTAYLNNPAHDVTSETGRKAAIDYAAALAASYGESAAAVACQMYDAVANASSVVLPPAVPAATPTYGEVAKTVNGMLKHNYSNDAVASSIGRLVKRTGVDTTLQNALRDGAEFAWVPHGDTCSFCIMLASNGWQKASKKTIKGEHAEHIHANCDCTFAVRFDGKSGVKGYDPDKYREIYDNAEGNNWKEKLRSMERDEREAHKDEINARKRELYAERNEFKSVFEKYKNTSTPGIGKFEIPSERKIKNNEKTNMKLIHSQFGGDISMPVESNLRGKKNPDYYWRNKYWEEQEPQSFSRNAVDKNIREALHQIAENPGGIVLDIGKSEMPLSEVREIALHRMRRSSPFDCDLILIRNGIIEEVWGYKKIKR